MSASKLVSIQKYVYVCMYIYVYLGLQCLFESFHPFFFPNQSILEAVVKIICCEVFQ